MEFRFTFCFVIVCVCQLAVAQQVDTTLIRQKLAVIYERDQKTRANADSLDYIDYIDSTNLVYVESIIAKYGWPGISFVGPIGNRAVFLVIQHADLATQIKYFPLMQQSVQDGESYPAELALLEDRILMRQGKPQKYGSQVIPDDATGGWKFYTIEDEDHVNERRKEMGLQPIEEYAKYFGIVYIAPGKQDEE